MPGTGVPDPAGSDQSVCPFLEVDTIPGRKWACGLRRQLGDWGKVHRSRPYKEQVQPRFAADGIANCGDWRVEGQCCFGPDNDPIYNLE